MTPIRWLLTILSFAATIGVSLYMVFGWSQHGATLTLPPRAHLLAAAAVAVEVLARALKIRWSAQAAGIQISLGTATRTCLGGDFAAAITPARSGAEPARFFVLSETGLRASSVLVVLYAELFLEVFSLAAVVFVVGYRVPPRRGRRRDAGEHGRRLRGGDPRHRRGGAVPLAPHHERSAAARGRVRLRLTGGRWRTIQTALIKLRATIESVERVRTRPAIYAFLASVVHVGIRLTVLPALVLTSAPTAPLAPLALWPLGFLYGAAVVPAPGGGGAVEMAFRAALGGTIPPAALRRRAHLVALLHLLHLHPARRTRGGEYRDASGAEDGGVRGGGGGGGVNGNCAVLGTSDGTTDVPGLAYQPHECVGSRPRS